MTKPGTEHPMFVIGATDDKLLILPRGVDLDRFTFERPATPRTRSSRNSVFS